MPIFKKSVWKAADMKPNKVFGAPLETWSTIPPILNSSMGYLVKKGLQLEGIFRISGNNAEIEKLVKAYSKGKEVDHTKLKSDPHAVAGVLKLWFRMLPTPLLTYALFDEFIEAAGTLFSYSLADPNFVTRVASYKNIIKKLPKTNGLVLERLIGLLTRVYGYARINKMTSSNLAIVFGPNLLVRETPLMDPRKAMEENSTINKITETLIEQFDYLYRNKKPKPPDNVDQSVIDANFQETQSTVVVLKSSVDKVAPVSRGTDGIPTVFASVTQQRNKTLRNQQVVGDDPQSFYSAFKYARYMDNKILRKYVKIPDLPSHMFSKKIIEASDPLDDDVELWDYENVKAPLIHLPQLKWVDEWEPIPLPLVFRDTNDEYQYGGFSLDENPSRRAYPAVEGIASPTETRQKLDEQIEVDANMNPKPLDPLDGPESEPDMYKLVDLRVPVSLSEFSNSLKPSLEYVSHLDTLFDQALLADFPQNMVIHTNIIPESVTPILFPIPTQDSYSSVSVPLAQIRLRNKLKGELGSKIPTEEEIEATRKKIEADRQARIEQELREEAEKNTATATSLTDDSAPVDESPKEPEVSTPPPKKPVEVSAPPPKRVKPKPTTPKPSKSLSSPDDTPPRAKPRTSSKPSRTRSSSSSESSESSESKPSVSKSPAKPRRGRGSFTPKGRGSSVKGPAQLGDIIGKGALSPTGLKKPRSPNGPPRRKSSSRRPPPKNLADLP